jgi:hypothetical protein
MALGFGLVTGDWVTRAGAAGVLVAACVEQAARTASAGSAAILEIFTGV